MNPMPRVTVRIETLPADTSKPCSVRRCAADAVAELVTDYGPGGGLWREWPCADHLLRIISFEFACEVVA